MPVDSRRLQGPETAFSYTLIEQEDEDEMQTDDKGAIIDANGSRRDKRKAIDARPMCKFTLIIKHTWQYLQIICVHLSSKDWCS